MFANFPLPSTISNKLKKFDELMVGNSINDIEAFSPLDLKNIIQKSQLANLVIPTKFGGQGCSLDELLIILHHTSQSSPSLAVMLCMHYHVVATLAKFPDVIPMASELLTLIAKDNKLIASAFSEGVPGMNIFDSSVEGTSLDQGVCLNGSKQPCSMSSVADYYAVSMVVDKQQAGIAIVKNDTVGVSNKAFWPHDFLKAADSNQVIFDNVMVDHSYTRLDSPEEMEGILSYGLAGFNLMINAAYSGVAVTLANKLPSVALKNTSLYIDLQGKLMVPFYAGMGLVNELSNLDNLEAALNNILIVRYQNQNTLKEIIGLVNENVGAFSYLADPEVIQLGVIANLMAFHPMSRYQFEQLVAQKLS
jgi:hypothetical protein